MIINIKVEEHIYKFFFSFLKFFVEIHYQPIPSHQIIYGPVALCVIMYVENICIIVFQLLREKKERERDCLEKRR
jgi:hypothetical protein